MRLRTALLAALLLSMPAWPAEPKLPDPLPLTLEGGAAVTVEIGHRCIIAPKTSARKLTWNVPPGVETFAIDGKRLAVWAPVGTYTIRAMAPNGDEVLYAEIVLTVTGPRPPPGPTPDPTPVDQFAKALADAYSSTPAAERALIPLLAAVWADELRHLETEPNGGAVLDALIAGRRAAPIADPQLRAIRNVIDAPLVTIFGTKSVPLTPEVIAAAKVQFQKTVDALIALK